MTDEEKQVSDKTIEKLLFIDANKWLDFYRADNETGLKLLHDVEEVSDRLIVTYLLEVEFKKKRQKVLIESWKSLTPPKLAFSGIIADATKTLKAQMEAAKKRVLTAKKLMMDIMASPAEHDLVYQAVERMFHRESDLVLSRDNDLRKEIRDKAERRFWQGYPPRKERDTSMGDAFNWEWMVNCAEKHKSELVIITRDSDFGVTIGDKCYLNDHLKQEFK